MGYCSDESRDIDFNRASGNAPGLLALDASARLGDRHLLGEAQVDLFEGGLPFLQAYVWHLLARLCLFWQVEPPELESQDATT